MSHLDTGYLDPTRILAEGYAALGQRGRAKGPSRWLYFALGDSGFDHDFFIRYIEEPGRAATWDDRSALDARWPHWGAR